jgi:hypothetical protein
MKLKKLKGISCCLLQDTIPESTYTYTGKYHGNREGKEKEFPQP